MDYTSALSWLDLYVPYELAVMFHAYCWRQIDSKHKGIACTARLNISHRPFVCISVGRCVLPTIELNADLSSSYSSIVPPILATLKLRESLNGTYADHFIVFSKDNAVIASDFNTQFGCSQGSEDKAEGLFAVPSDQNDNDNSLI